MPRRSRKKITKLGGLASNRKIQVLFLFALLGIGLLASTGMLPAQNIYGYDDRAFNHVFLRIEAKTGQSTFAIYTPEYISSNPYPGYAGTWHCFYRGFVYFYLDTMDALITAARLDIYIVDPATHEDGLRIWGSALDSYSETTVDGRPVGRFYRIVNEYLGGAAGTGGDYGEAGTLFKAKWTVTNADGVSEVYELPMQLFEAPPDISIPPGGLPDTNLVGPADFTHTFGNPAIPLTWSWNSEVSLNTITLDSSVGSGYYVDISGSSWTFDQNDPGTHLVIWDESVGVHTYTFTVTDQYGREFIDTVVVTVEEATLEALVVFTSTPNDLTVIEHGIGDVVSWSFTGYTSIISINLWEGLYNHYSYGAYYSGTFPFDVNNLDVGVHMLTLVIVDSNGFTIEDEVVVTILNAQPELSSPSDVSFEEGITGHTIWWSFNEPVFATLVVTGTISDTHYPITDLGYVEIVLDHLGVGDYTYTLTIEDYYGATNSDAVDVSVLEPTEVDVTSPIITHPADISDVGSMSETLSWTVTDESAGTYTIERDGTQVASGNWESGDVITYDVSESMVGSYTYVITCVDVNGNEVSDEVVVILTADDGEPEPPPFDLGAIIEEYGLFIVVGIVGLVVVSIIIGSRKKNVAQI